ncbi:MAG: HAMP domain-containing sensor histidine kinase [Anaerolineales bacterium]
MSIRFRLTLLYSAILALTLIVFGTALYTIQAQETMNALQANLIQSGNGLAQSILNNYLNPNPLPKPPGPPPVPIETLSGDQAFNQLRERVIVRVLDSNGALVASPFAGQDQDNTAQALPLGSDGLQVLKKNKVWWETSSASGDQLLIYNVPVIYQGNVHFIVQVAQSLAERDQTLADLSRTLIIASLLTILIAFGIGWILSGESLRPIHRITQTAQVIGKESDFTRRVDYKGPNDEIGQLASTFNSMLTRLQDAYQGVSRTLKMQRDFVADVSHELRTPLTTIRGNLELLRREPPIPHDEQSDVLTDVVDESDRLIRLVNNLLILARADAGQSLTRETFPVRTVIEDACKQARQLDRQRRIIEDVQDVSVIGDRDATKQVLLILLDNAIKYTTEEITVSAKAAGNQVLICVSDQGPGISSEKLDRVFDRFYRGGTDSNIQGFGLGLPIAKALIESQGGKIEIQSESTLGTIVKIGLPSAKTTG